VIRVLVVFIALVVCALPCRADAPAAKSETRIELKVAPARAPQPILRYMLLPELRELSPGNPIHSYMKCAMEQQSFFFDKEGYARRERLLAMPLKELPAKELQDYGRSVLSQVDEAARLDNPDWQILLKLKKDGFTTLLPELQQIRGFARALQLRFRAEVALGRFDAAMHTAKTMFAMARHLGEHPTFIGNLVGIAIASIAIEPLEEMIAQPGSPNLYWALASLPCPLVDCRRGLEGERMSLEWFSHDVNERAPMTADQIKKYLEFVEKMLGDPTPGTRRAQHWLDSQTKEPKKLDAALRRLVEYGLSEKVLHTFPAEQVILVDAKRELFSRFDDKAKNLVFPAWQGEALAARTASKQEPAFFADAFLPAVESVQIAQGRIDQRIALLRAAEALRLHAAEHDGKLPASLSEITLPLANDPYTGKPFRYESNDNTAHLRGTPPKRFEKLAVYNIHYVITMQDKPEQVQ
jgi:hypothetical protein